MGDEQQPKDAQQPKKDTAFAVAASPFNAIKLELVIVLIVGFLLWLLLDSITDNDWTHITILLAYSVSGALWLSLRIRKVTRQSSNANPANTNSADG